MEIRKSEISSTKPTSSKTKHESNNIQNAEQKNDDIQILTETHTKSKCFSESLNASNQPSSPRT